MTQSVFVNRGGMATATAGTGTITLGAALGAVAPNVCSFLSFAGAGVANSNQVSYLILDSNGAWEVGIGVYTSAGTTLTRTVSKSSNSNAAINLSGSAQVFVTARAEDIFNLIGVTDASNAAAGNVGEYIESVIATGSAVSLTNNTAANLTSISLTAGDWDVDVVSTFNGGATTMLQTALINITTASATLDFTNGRNCSVTYGTTGVAVFAQNVITPALPPLRFNVSSTTTIYAVAQAGFTVSTCTVYGILRARRVR